MSKHSSRRGFSGPHHSSSATAEHFAQIPSVQIQRSKFDRSHAFKTTFNEGKLIPIFVDEVLPGDTFHMKSTLFSRLATPLYPIMDNLYLDAQFFFVPYRLVWDHWQQFMGERNSPSDDPSIYSVPQFNCSMSATPLTSTMWDYFGLPQTTSPAATNTVSVSALPFRKPRSSFGMSGTVTKICRTLMLFRLVMVPILISPCLI